MRIRCEECKTVVAYDGEPHDCGCGPSRLHDYETTGGITILSRQNKGGSGAKG